jgi:hypothetical protein
MQHSGVEQRVGYNILIETMFWEKNPKTRQSTLDAYFKKIADNCSENEPQPGPSYSM